MCCFNKLSHLFDGWKRVFQQREMLYEAADTYAQQFEIFFVFFWAFVALCA